MESKMSKNAFQFTTLNNNADPTFNQLLGINNKGVIAGYFGSGTPPTTHPNKGYTLAPPYGQGDYTNENFPGSQQTQVIGINDPGLTVGFWADANGDNFGFVDHKGTFTDVVDPNAPIPSPGTPSVTQLLGLNNHGEAAGFYTDAAGNNHGFIYHIAGQTFAPVTIDGSTSVTATDINNNGEISGFYQNGTATDGFLDNHGKITTLTGPQGATDVMAFGLNDKGQVVGSFVDANGNTDGFLYNAKSHLYTTIVDPNAQPATPGGPTTTVVNGLNDKGQLVGFYTDANGNTDGMLVSTQGSPHSHLHDEFVKHGSPADLIPHANVPAVSGSAGWSGHDLQLPSDAGFAVPNPMTSAVPNFVDTHTHHA
jgi:probable HAF family extracellular repeat protein